MIILRKLAEQQKTQRAHKIKKRILKQTHDIKLAESLSPIEERLDEVKETTSKVGDVFRESKQKTPQLAIENTQTPQPIENIEGILYDVELEINLTNMRDNSGFLQHITILNVDG